MLGWVINVSLDVSPIIGQRKSFLANLLVCHSKNRYLHLIEIFVDVRTYLYLLTAVADE